MSDDGAKFTANRGGIPLCEEFQVGACPSKPGSAICPKDPRKAHQCEKCLDTRHGGAECGQKPKAPPKPGGGKGGGRGGRGGRF